MIDIEDFLTKVLPLCPGVPEPVAIEHVRNAARDFCEATKLWRWDDEFDLGDDPNSLCSPQDSVIHKIERCDWNGRRLTPETVGNMDDRRADWDSSDPDRMWRGEPQYYLQTAIDTIRLAPFPYDDADPRKVKLRLILVPSEDAEMLPDFLYDHYRTTLAWGAAGSILMLDGQNFSNPEKGIYYQGKFDAALGRKSSLQQKGQQQGPIRTKANFF